MSKDGLVPKQITDKNGKVTTVWVRPDQGGQDAGAELNSAPAISGGGGSGEQLQKELGQGYFGGMTDVSRDGKMSIDMSGDESAELVPDHLQHECVDAISVEPHEDGQILMKPVNYNGEPVNSGVARDDNGDRYPYDRELQGYVVPRSQRGMRTVTDSVSAYHEFKSDETGDPDSYQPYGEKYPGGAPSGGKSSHQPPFGGKN